MDLHEAAQDGVEHRLGTLPVELVATTGTRELAVAVLIVPISTFRHPSGLRVVADADVVGEVEHRLLLEDQEVGDAAEAELRHISTFSSHRSVESPFPLRPHLFLQLWDWTNLL